MGNIGGRLASQSSKRAAQGRSQSKGTVIALATQIAPPQRRGNGNVRYTYRLEYGFDAMWGMLLDMERDASAETSIKAVKVSYKNQQGGTTVKQIDVNQVEDVISRFPKFRRWIVLVTYRGLKLQLKFDGMRNNTLVITSSRDDGGLVEESFIPDLEYSLDGGDTGMPDMAYDDDVTGDEFADIGDMYDGEPAEPQGYPAYPDYQQQVAPEQFDSMPAMQSPQQQSPQMDQRGRIIGDSFGKYMTLSILELILSVVAANPLCIILSIVAFFKTIGAHSKIKTDQEYGRRKYHGTKIVMTINIVLILISLVLVGSLLFLWYTNRLPQQLGFIYSVLG